MLRFLILHILLVSLTLLYASTNAFSVMGGKSSSYSLCTLSKPLCTHSKPSSPTRLYSKSKPPRDLVLYRDNNGWCPFCERTWTLLEQTKTPYTEKLINLRSKPQYYLKLVPTTLVPAIQFDVSVRKDKDIIKELESDTFSNVTKIMKRRNPFARMMGKRRVVIWEVRMGRSEKTLIDDEINRLVKCLDPSGDGQIDLVELEGAFRKARRARANSKN